MRNRKLGQGVVSVEFHSHSYKETCVGIILKSSPLIVIVPEHAAQSLEDGTAPEIHVDGVLFHKVAVAHDAQLAGAHLTALRLTEQDREQSWTSIRNLPRRVSPLSPGSPLSIVGPVTDKGDHPISTGRATEINADLEGESIVTDIPVESGQSGSPLLHENRLCGIVQAQKLTEDGAIAVGISLSSTLLSQLHLLARIPWRRNLRLGLSLLAISLLPLALFFILGSRSYPIEGYEILEDTCTVLVQRNTVFPTRPTWTFTASTSISTVATVASSPAGNIDYVAVGSRARPTSNGVLSVLDSSGRLQWEYSIPEHECIYENETQEDNDWFAPTHITPSDLDEDGQNELIVAFAHMTWRPAKIMVFELDGTILREYWHPGYVRVILSGKIDEGPPMTIISASNNSLKWSWWNPQVLFAFRGLDIKGQGPEPEFGESRSSHVWYWVINNIDPESLRAKAKYLAFIDYNGDESMDIRAGLTDGRFYYFDASGSIIGTAVGDFYARDFGDTPFPELWSVERQLQFLNTLAADDSSD